MTRILTCFRFRRQCAWCGKYMGGWPFARLTTSGMCLPCVDRTANELAALKRRQLIKVTEAVRRAK